MEKITMSKQITAARGPKLRCQGWRQEGLLRLLENVLENGERPEDLIVYASLAKAARNWGSYDAIVKALQELADDETLVIQSGKPIAVFQTHRFAPLVIMANGNIVGKWATSANFYDLQDKGLIAWGGLTAGDWQYIGSQGVIQGTYEIFSAIARKHFRGSLSGRFILTAGLGGMGGAQPLAGIMAEASILVVEANEVNIDKRLAIGYLQHKSDSLDHALRLIREAKARKQSISVGLLGNAATVYTDVLKLGITPDIVTDQTSAHDLLYGYVPEGYSLDTLATARRDNPDQVIRDAGKTIAKAVTAMLAFKQAGAIVFDNGNNIRTGAHANGVTEAFSIDMFTEAYLRPLFCRGIGPFRWVALSGDPEDIETIDTLILGNFADNADLTRWIKLARRHIPFQGLPARIGWMGHGDRTKLALLVQGLVKSGKLKGPVAFTRDHLDGAAMTHPNIMTENMLDGSDAISDWPLLNALLSTSSMADLVAIHSGGGGYTGYMTSAGLTVIADGTSEADIRLETAITNDTGLGVLRYADAGYDDAIQSSTEHNLNRIEVRS
jgi:urocanate hydratase